MTDVINKVLQNKLTYKGKVILKYKIEFPQVLGCDKFNLLNYTNALELQKKCENELYEEAKKTFDYNASNNFPIMVYEVISGYIVTYNYNFVLSLYTDEYIFTGGAHGNTVRTSQTWELKTQHIKELYEYFPKNPNYVSYILKTTNSQIGQNIKNGNNYYFDDYCCLTAEHFRVENYYLSNGFLVIYYQQYDIAPYSSGILNFYISI